MAEGLGQPMPGLQALQGAWQAEARRLTQAAAQAAALQWAAGLPQPLASPLLPARQQVLARRRLLVPAWTGGCS